MNEEYKPVCWFKHGPYEGSEPLQCVFDDPQDSDCFSPLFGGPLADAAPDLLAVVQRLLRMHYNDGIAYSGDGAEAEARRAVAKALGAA